MSYVHNATAHTASVFGPAGAPVAWTNLDISAVTGAQTVFALLKFELSGGIDPRIAVRPDGDGDEYFAAGGNPHGSSRAFLAVAGGESCLLACKTSSLGVIEWKASVAATTEVFVLGYIVITTDATNIYTGTLPTSWTDLDLSTVTGQRSLLAIFKWHRSGGTANNFALRPGDDTDDYLVTTPEVGGPNMDGNESTNIYSNVLVKTDPTAVAEWSAESVAPAGTLDMAAYAPIYPPTAGEEQVFASANPPVAWGNLALTASTGPLGLTGMPAARCLVLLKVHHAVGAGLRVIAVRGDDDTGNYLTTRVAQMKGCACCELESDQTALLMCETGAAGGIQWISDLAGINVDIELLGWIPAPAAPTVSNEHPEGNTVQAAHPAIGCVITDDDGIDTTTIGLTATDARGRVTTIISAGVVQTGWTGSIIVTAPGDREITIEVASDDTELGNGERHTFSLSATNYGGASL